MFSLMTPSRGRPERLQAMAESALDTAASPDEIEIIVWLDDDDPFLHQYKNIPRIKYLIGPRDVIHSSRWDRCLPKSTGDLLFHLNDDVVIGTPAWDEMVSAEFDKYPDRLLMVHGDDLGCQRDRFGCHPIIHRRWLDTLGYFIPDCFDGEYGDAAVNLIANHIGRRRFLPFICEHRHYLFGKGEIDQTAIEYQEKQAKQNPREMYIARMQTWINDAEKLRRTIG